MVRLMRKRDSEITDYLECDEKKITKIMNNI